MRKLNKKLTKILGRGVSLIVIHRFNCKKPIKLNYNIAEK